MGVISSYANYLSFNAQERADAQTLQEISKELNRRDSGREPGTKEILLYELIIS